MFKSNKQTKPARKPGGGAALMQQMGFQVPNFDTAGLGQVDDDDDDNDLEAELKRLQMDDVGHSRNRGARGNQKNSDGMPQDLHSFHRHVDKLLSDIDKPLDDNDLSDVDEDELLAELNEITDEFATEQHNQKSETKASSTGNVLSLLEARQEMYKKASAAAKTSGEAAKARRLERQLNTIQDLLKQARAGQAIDENEIPPEVFAASQSTSSSQQVPTRAPSPPRSKPEPAPSSRPNAVPLPPFQTRTTAQPQPAPRAQAQAQVPIQSNNSNSQIDQLKKLALQAKQQGDMAKAKEYIIQLKTLQEKQTAPVQRSLQKETYDNVPDDDAPPPPMPLKAPEPRTTMEALQQRYEELTKRGEEAARSGDSSKARRMERLTKQYEEAIDATRKGRPYNYNELPDLPGFAPIPPPQGKSQPAAPAVGTATKPAVSNPQPRSSQGQQQRPSVTSPSNNAIVARKNQQAQTLRLKQEKFHKLAVQAKQQGDMESAKKFLVAYKGLEQMIAAAEQGLPIDMSQVPKLPDDEDVLINDDDLTQDLARADRDTVFRRLQDDLLRQIQLCVRNQQIYAEMGDASSARHANEYKTLEQRCERDLEKLRQCFQRGLKPPLFHYERKQMNIIQSNNDLGENDLEVTILRGINLPAPQSGSTSLETYVAIEFPYPTDEPQTARTRHAAGSANAEYPESVHKFYIKRNDAKFRRLMNRKELKFIVFYKPGFLRSDRPLASASIKLVDLENKCTIHDSVDLYECEHRKKMEGKLEVKLRIKEALGQTRASDILPQRWLVIDRFEEASHSSKPSSTSKAGPAPAITAISRLVPTGEVLSQIAINMAEKKVNDEIIGESRVNVSDMTDRQRRRVHQHQEVPINPQSVQVLNHEASVLQQQIEQLQDQLSLDQLQQLQRKLRQLQDQSDQIVDSLRRGGKQALQEHVQNLEELVNYYDQEARECHQRRDTKKADMNLMKKKLVLKEIGTLTGQPSSTRF